MSRQLKPEEDTHLLQKIRRPVKVLLVWRQRGAGGTEGSSVLEEEEDEEEATEVEVKGSSPSWSEVSC